MEKERHGTELSSNCCVIIVHRRLKAESRDPPDERSLLQSCSRDRCAMLASPIKESRTLSDVPRWRSKNKTRRASPPSPPQKGEEKGYGGKMNRSETNANSSAASLDEGTYYIRRDRRNLSLSLSLSFCFPPAPSSLTFHPERSFLRTIPDLSGATIVLQLQFRHPIPRP